jgi:hypothetical protein
MARPTPTPWACSRDTIFTNVALTPDGDVWWEGMTKTPPAQADRLAGQGVDAGQRPQGGASQRPLHRPRQQQPVPSTRPGKTRPACRSAPSSSAAGAGHGAAGHARPPTGCMASTSPPPWARRPPPPPSAQTGVVRRDPFAMLPFAGYHMADYFNHWLSFGRTIPNPPRIFSVNWFRTRCQWPVRVAWLWREHAGAEVDRRTRPRWRRGWPSKAPSAGCRAMRIWTGPAWTSASPEHWELSA